MLLDVSLIGWIETEQPIIGCFRSNGWTVLPDRTLLPIRSDYRDLLHVIDRGLLVLAGLASIVAMQLDDLEGRRLLLREVQHRRATHRILDLAVVNELASRLQKQ